METRGLQALTFLAGIMGAVPVLVFLLTLYLTDGAPLRSPPREEGMPAAATTAVPHLASLQHSGVAATGSLKQDSGGFDLAMGVDLTDQDVQSPSSVIDLERDAEVYTIVFGNPEPAVAQ